MSGTTIPEKYRLFKNVAVVVDVLQDRHARDITLFYSLMKVGWGVSPATTLHKSSKLATIAHTALFTRSLLTLRGSLVVIGKQRYGYLRSRISVEKVAEGVE